MTVLYIKAETSKDYPVPLLQLQGVLQEQQTQDKARTYTKNTGKIKSFINTHSYYALFFQSNHMQLLLSDKIRAQFNLGIPHAIKNPCTYAIVIQIHMYKNSNFKKRKNSKKYSFRWCILWSSPYWLADKEFTSMCVGKKALITGNLQSTGKKVSVLYIKAELSKEHLVLLQPQRGELQEQQTLDKARTYN